MGFENVKQHLTITPERTFRVELDLPRPPGAGQPALLVRCASVNAAFKAARDKMEVVSGTSETHELLRRQILAPIFAQFLVAGWENIYESGATEPCAFGPEKLGELMLALAACEPADQFYRATNASFSLANFRDGVIDPDALGKK